MTASPASVLVKRARRKYLTTGVATALSEVAKCTDSPLQAGYRNSVYCNASLRQEDGKVTGTYCGNRWCLVCAAIRTARAINAYLPIISEWSDAHFVTLTLRNVPAAELDATIARMQRIALKVKDSMRKTDKIKLVGIRKLECTYNAERDDYHPHFHFTVETAEMARALRDRWLDHCGSDADAKGQKIQRASAGTLAELFKYFTKLVTKAKMINAVSLDVIFRAMKGRRVYQSIGFKKPKLPDEDEAIELDAGTNAPTRAAECIAWEWNQAAADWVDAETGDCLTGYEPGERFRAFVDGIDVPAADAGPARLAAPAKVNEDESRAATRRRMMALELPMTPEFVSAALQNIWNMSAARAREMAGAFTRDETQLVLLPIPYAPPARVAYD